MSEDFLSSSDGARSARPLRHARSVTFTESLELELGGRLERVTVAYETWGSLSPARDNAVLVCHALSGDSHVARHEAADDPGWWEIMVGPGKPIDTGRRIHPVDGSSFSICLEFFVPETIGRVVVDHPHGLHDGRSSRPSV